MFHCADVLLVHNRRVSGVREGPLLGDIRLPSAHGEDHYVRRVVRSLDRRRFGAVALVTLLLSAGPLSGAELGFFSPAEIALLWLEHFVELALLAATLTIAYTLL